MVRGIRVRFGLALVISMSLGWPPQVVAQESSLPTDVTAPSYVTAVHRNQLTLARKLEQRALEGIAGSGDSSIPIDPVARQAANDAYVLLRAARLGMRLQKQALEQAKKYHDPVLDLVFKRVEDAWNLSRYPVDRASWGMERADYVRLSVQNMTQAIRLLDQALLMMP